MTLELEYELKERNALTPLTDALFIRRALRDSLKRSLIRFARERRADSRTWPLDPGHICRCTM